MGIALMPHVKDQAVTARIVDPMQRDRQLHRAQIGRQMSPGSGNGFDQESADLIAQGLQLLRLQFFYIFRGMDPLQYTHSISPKLVNFFAVPWNPPARTGNPYPQRPP